MGRTGNERASSYKEFHRFSSFSLFFFSSFNLRNKKEKYLYAAKLRYIGHLPVCIRELNPLRGYRDIAIQTHEQLFQRIRMF